MEASWNPDPSGKHQFRYWNGSDWTEWVANDGVQAVDPIVIPPPPTATTTHASQAVSSSPPPPTASSTLGPGLQIPSCGSGRRLSSTRPPFMCATTLAGVLNVHSPTPYRHMEPLTPATIVSQGGHGTPLVARACSYGDDKYLFLFWNMPNGGSEIGFFALGGEDRLTTPLIGQWKQADASLSSIGRIDGAKIFLLPPQVGYQYFTETLDLAGKAHSEANIAFLIDQTSFLFRIKAQGFVEAIAGSSSAARFMHDLPQGTDVDTPAIILQALGNWDTGIIPYLQDLPWRIRGIQLEDPGGKWDELDPAP